jgi:hypothetical protein
MLLTIVGLNGQDLSVEYIRTENVTVGKEVILYEDTEFIVPNGLNPIAVKGKIDELTGEIVIIEDEQRVYAWKELRRIRAQKLAESDWTQFTDVSMSTEKRNAWIAYRQELRDLPYKITDPLTVMWPSMPV